MTHHAGHEGKDGAVSPPSGRAEEEGVHERPIERHRLAFTPLGQRRGPWWTPQELPADVVGVTSSDSFPASDPPSWSGLFVGPPHDQH